MKHAHVISRVNNSTNVPVSYLLTEELSCHMRNNVKRCGYKETRNYHLLWFTAPFTLCQKILKTQLFSIKFGQTKCISITYQV